MKNILSITAIVALIGIGGTGCASGNSQPESKSGSPQGLQSRVGDANDPFDAYLAADLLAINSALRELDYKCYADNGYPQYLDVLPAQKANDFRSSALTPDLETTFASFSALPWFESEESARATGYGHSYPAMDPVIFATDPALVEVIKECRGETMQKVSGSEELLGEYSQLGNTLTEAIIVAAKQNKAPLTDKVFACMAKGPYAVDANGPNKSDDWGVDFGVPLGSQPQPEFAAPPKGSTTQVLPGSPAKVYVPTAQESDSAAEMHRCSLESGAQEVWLKAMMTAKEAAVAENEAKLTELNPAIKELAKSAAMALQTKG